MHRDLCAGQPSLCDAMKPTKGADLLKYLRKVEFQGEFISFHFFSFLFSLRPRFTINEQ